MQGKLGKCARNNVRIGEELSVDRNWKLDFQVVNVDYITVVDGRNIFTPR